MAMLSKHTWVMITCILTNNNAGMTALPDQMYAPPLEFLHVANPLSLPAFSTSQHVSFGL